MRGDGYVYARNGVWYAWTSRDGRPVRESLHTADRHLAERRLGKLRQARERGTYLAPTERRITVEELLDDLLVHLELKGAASVGKAASHLKAVRVELGAGRAAALDTATVERIQKDWRGAKVAPATVNRRCELLRQAYNLAARRTPPKVRMVPHIPLLKVQNARQGFLARADFQALLEQLVDVDVRDYVEWSFWTGMRPGEIRQLTWVMYDKETKTLNLDPAAAKIRRGRAIPLKGPLAAIMERRLKRRRLDCRLIFHRVSRGHVGRPVKDYARQWKAALEGAGLAPGLTPYDLRRTALRNMVRGGTDVAVAMKISGHRTRSTFDRYNIVDAQDLEQAIDRTAAYVSSLPAKRKVQVIKR